MNRPELRKQLQALARRYPGIHPYTLVLHFQAQTGRVLTVQQVKQLLAEPGKNRDQLAKL
jgi:hypothetical protein